MSLGLTRRGGVIMGETGCFTDAGLTLLSASREKEERKENVENRCVLGRRSEGACLPGATQAGTASYFLFFCRAEMAFPASLDHPALLAPR